MMANIQFNGKTKVIHLLTTFWGGGALQVACSSWARDQTRAIAVQSSDNDRSLTQCATRELLLPFYLFFGARQVKCLFKDGREDRCAESTGKF